VQHTTFIYADTPDALQQEILDTSQFFTSLTFGYNAETLVHYAICTYEAGDTR